MGTEVLSPGDCLKGNKFYNSAFSSPKPTQNRRKSPANRQAPAVQLRRTPSPKTKKFNRKSSSPPPPCPSQSMEGVRLLKRGEALAPAEKPSDRTSPEPVTPVQTRPRRFGSDPGVSGEEKSILGRFKAETELKTPGEGKSGRFLADPVVSITQPGQIKPKHELVTPPTKAAAGRGRNGPIYAGPAFTAASPEPSSLPLPSFLRKSSSTGSTSEDEASQTLRCLLKLNIL